MNKKKLFEKDFYKQATMKRSDVLKRVTQQMGQNVKRSAIIEEATVASQEISDLLKQGYDDLIEQITNGKATIKSSYENKSDYTNPQAEILKRQDFDMRLKLMEPYELESFLKQSEALSMDVYQLNAIKLHLRTLPDSMDNDRAAVELIKLENNTTVGREYELTDNWKALDSLDTETRQFRPSMLWIDNGQGEYAPVSSSIMEDVEAMLKSYY